MKALFTLCARAGSKGVKNKNTRIFLERPLVEYTLDAFEKFLEKNKEKYTQIDLAVNTDSQLLIEQIKKTNINFIYVKRKENLAGDFVSKTDVIRDTVFELESKEEIEYDLVIDLDLTSPLRRADDIQKCIETLLNNDFAEVAFSMTHARRLPFFNMVQKNKDESYSLIIKSNYVSRQQAPQCFDMNASIYVYRRNFITNINTNQVFDGKAVGYLMEDTGILDIDSEEDFKLMEIFGKYFFGKSVVI